MRKDDKLRYFKGSLVGGAIGDALGYSIEFMPYSEIVYYFGEQGIREFCLEGRSQAGLSDDTQMTLFTANGILVADTMRKVAGQTDPVHTYVHKAYLDWLVTQRKPKPTADEDICWLLSVPELRHRRAPGATCLSALQSATPRDVAHPINTSKGCGGVMRIAPYGLFYGGMLAEDKAAFLREAAEIGAITHGHTMSNLSCALMADILAHVIYGNAEGVYEEGIAAVTQAALAEVLEAIDSDQKEEFASLVRLAIQLAEAGGKDEENIRRLGQGWVAEEAIAIAVYCACRYQHDPMEGIIAAVNHSGDSDSTGAVTGNILGALHGYDAFPADWVRLLEARDVIEEIATDLATGCPNTKDATVDEAWNDKYMRHTRRE